VFAFFIFPQKRERENNEIWDKNREWKVIEVATTTAADAVSIPNLRSLIRLIEVNAFACGQLLLSK
jgi:hypothetical protein